MFACTYLYMFVWVYTGEINAKRTREKYLEAVLRQDIAYFDNVGAGEVATRIQTDTRTFLVSIASSGYHIDLRYSESNRDDYRSSTTSYVGESCAHR